MIIEKNKVVQFFYSLKNAQGNEIENNAKATPTAYLHGYKNIFPALEAELNGLQEGDEKSITLEPRDAYGLRRDNAAQKIPVKHLIGKYKKLLPGMLVKVNTQDGAKDASVIKAGKFMVEVDFNHPLAGQALTFDIKIASIRDASDEEIAHGHAHGVGGHHH